MPDWNPLSIFNEHDRTPSAIDTSRGNLLRHDLPASVVIFLAALPLCLGVAIASGAPPFAGIIASIVGGVVVGLLSGSQISVTGPAAGLAVFVAGAIQFAGSYRAFLGIVVLAGFIQFLFGLLRLGALADYVPNSVIRGMLAAMGLVIILKQIPHALGRDLDFEGDFNFVDPGGNTTFTDISNSVVNTSVGAVAVFALSLALLLAWQALSRRISLFRYLPGPVVAVLGAVLGNQLFGGIAPGLQIVAGDHLITMPAPPTLAAFFKQFTLPEFTAIGNPRAWLTALILALVASVESLFSLEAADRLDPFKRISSPNRELCAQGVGNMVSGLIGGLPMAAVVVRTSANAYSGGRTRLSTVTHGVLLALSALFLPNLLHLIPLAALAAILMVIGFQLTSPARFIQMYRLGWDQFVPFVVTVVAIVLSDLLTGVAVGFVFGAFFVFRRNHHEAVTVVNEGANYLVRFTKEATFVNKNEFRNKLRQLPSGCHVIIDGTRALFIDRDIRDVVEDFQQLAPYKNIQVELKHWEDYKVKGEYGLAY